MKETFQKVLQVATIAALLATPGVADGQTPWTPPAARKARTPLAPKPHHGNNIFKGEREVWLAEAIDKLEGGIVDPLEDKAVTEYVSTVGKYVAAHSVAANKPYEFIVTDDSRPDALTAGGGRIYISVGMLKQIENEDELAGILAHEIAHDAFGHAARTVTRQLFWMTGTKRVESLSEVVAALNKLCESYEQNPIAETGEKLLGFSRFDELEADRAAFYNIYKAGYNPAALKVLLKRMAAADQQEKSSSRYKRDQLVLFLFGTHPPKAQRVLALSWEANFVRMPPDNSHVESPAFATMKQKVAEIENQ